MPRDVETPEYGIALRRMLTTYGHRCAVGDVEDLADLMNLRGELDDIIAAAVTEARADGRSWAEVARAAGSSRQAAQQRWGSA